MDMLLTILALCWGIRIAGNILSYVHLWWVKEYRWDRMLIHLETPQGRRIFWPAWRRPPVSPKSVMLVVLLGSGAVSAFVSLSETPLFFRLFITDLLMFPLSFLLVAIVNVPTRIYHRVLIRKAVEKLRLHTPMIVIGITGSYGKTTTKEYLSTILASKYNVIKTEASRNSPIGIAEVILHRLKPEHELFVVEMGAYKPGEIKEMASMVKPEIAIITAINEQHQDFFGSIESTMKAKYELIEGISGKHIAIMNLDDDRVREMASWAKRDGKEVWGITTQISNLKSQISKNKQTMYIATNTKASFEGIAFTCVSGDTSVPVQAPVIGVHQARNILCAIAGAVAAGMTIKEAAAAAGNLRPNPKSLSVIPGINGSIYINDTFNNSPDSAIAALNVLAWGNRRKLFVFQPMIELGASGGKRHREVGAYAARICDEIYLTNRNFYDDIIKGVRSQSQTIPVSILMGIRETSDLRGKLNQGDTALFKGKEAERVLQAIRV